MTSLRRMIGMPVVSGGKALGYVERGILTHGARQLKGLVIRRGLGSARWIPQKSIIVIGGACVVVYGESLKRPKSPEIQFGRVYLTTGECAGLVTDAVIDCNSLRVTALEVGNGPLCHLMGRRVYAMEYSVRSEEPHQRAEGIPCEIVTSRLCTWAQVMGQEERRKGHEHCQDDGSGNGWIRGGRGSDDDARQSEAQEAGASAVGTGEKAEQDVVMTGLFAQEGKKG